MTDQLDDRRKKLIFRSWHRGTREADLLIGSFAKENIPNFTEEQLAQFETIMERSDPDIYNWMTGREEEPEELKGDVMNMLKDYRFTGKRGA
ncbi:MAG: succinate dehydrogenase assembly factor 2 [Rickettsiales bacterium]|nr:succinate dehydrogenase assembly factor 2 [Rickettsiales bacterium]|tara:strand:- start:381 stop:656 length:276 start_codon:yes stop_codon:yes gene_type:complete